MSDREQCNTTRYPWVPPTWTEKFWCKRCGGIRLLIDHYNKAPTGAVASTVACLECREEYRIFWHVLQPDKYYVVIRWKWVQGDRKKGRLCRVAENSKDDLPRRAVDPGAVG